MVPRFIKHLRSALSDFRHVASIFPSSRFSVRAVMRHVDSPRLAIEYGPGTGIMTRPLLNHVASDGELIAVEANADFAAALREIADDRLLVEEGDIQAIVAQLLAAHAGKVDLVLSGIPFSFLPEAERESLIAQTAELLASTGRFVVYQNSLKVLSILERHFEKVRYSFEPRNVFPYFIMLAERPKR